ncbi:hypothetical protein [Hymenobacter properus]|uniref:Outer membrane protein beta-barrel domain-containing protein n=1 Tax=Hymenobacter properus TaxID=2791026 RepID=A0A931BIU0_9BACT|nr:hypothetical protein [Hymenobacter properus]MBF9142301.1 hypothetical protein [Hymenobacter properus]MBR7721108.1 hypothetical protein [Microvirga sp. SRT04]
MKQHYYFLLLALALPAAASAQTKPSAPDEHVTGYQATPRLRSRVYVGLQAAVPVYWRELSARDLTLDGWEVLAVFAGVRFNANWAVQVGLNVDGFGHSYDIIPGVTGPGGPGQPTGTGRFSGRLAAMPVLLRFNPGWRPAPQCQLEAFAGVTPQWQRFDRRESTALPGQPQLETTEQLRTTNLYATAGLAGVVNVGPGAEVTVEAALNQRSYSSGAAPHGRALAPTLGASFRYYFGSRPRHTSYL